MRECYGLKVKCPTGSQVWSLASTRFVGLNSWSLASSPVWWGLWDLQEVACVKEVDFWEQNLTMAYNPAPIPEEAFFSLILTDVEAPACKLPIATLR